MHPVRLLTAGLLTVALPLAAHPQDSKLRVAAAITYEETGRPQGLPEAFQPGSSATFLTITSIDGSSCRRRQTSACSRPPEPTTNTFIDCATQS